MAGPDEHRRRPVDPGRVEACAQEDAGEREREADERRGILEHDRERGRILRATDRLDDPAAAALLRERLDAEIPRAAFEDGRDRDDAVAERRAPGCDGIEDVRDAGHDGHPAAEPEDDHADEQRPEIELVAVTERVVDVGRPSARARAVEQQRAVAGIDERMDGFGEHRGAAGRRRGNELRHRDQQVADECRDNCPIGLFGHGEGVGPPGFEPGTKGL